jgi:hypothetical protein
LLNFVDGSKAIRTITTGLFSMSSLRAVAAASVPRTARPFWPMFKIPFQFVPDTELMDDACENPWTSDEDEK